VRRSVYLIDHMTTAIAVVNEPATMDRSAIVDGLLKGINPSRSVALPSHSGEGSATP
jgi:hypothetical protein